jgi:hypothetical protein
MHLSDALEVAIGLAFIYFVASLVLTSVREAIEGAVKIRGQALFQGIVEMLHDPKLAASGGKLADNGFQLALELYRHPLVGGLMKGTVDAPPANSKSKSARPLSTGTQKRRLPSYLPSRNVALAMMAQTMAGKFSLTAEAGTPFPPAVALPAVQQLRLLAQSIESAPLRDALVHAIDTSAGDFDSVRANLEQWFDSAMDRVTGYYKRWSQYIIFGLGLSLAIAVNVNSITIAHALFAAPPTRQELVDSAGLKAALQNCDPTKTASTCNYDDVLKPLAAAELPFGWSDSATAALLAPVKQADSPAGKLMGAVEIGAGWFLTAFAVSLGAPFWFSVLGRLNMIRNSLPPGETTEGSTNAPPPPGQAPAQVAAGGAPPPANAPSPSAPPDQSVYSSQPAPEERQFEADDGSAIDGVSANTAAPPPAAGSIDGAPAQ